VLALSGLAALVGGGALTIIDQTQRDSQGFLTSPTRTFESQGYALVSKKAELHLSGGDRFAQRFLGTVKLESTSDKPVLIGLARATDVDAYLGSVSRSIVEDISRGNNRYDERTGVAPATRPGEQTFWEASTTGTGQQTLTWEPRDGDWKLVVMNADASPGVTADIAIGAELDHIIWIGIGLLAGGFIVLLGGAGLMLLGFRPPRSH
jgi:hypothetical protein